MLRRMGLLIGVVVLVVALAGCSGAAATPTSEATTTGVSQAQRLALGTLRLEGTDQAVDSEQAAELLVLWKAYRSLSASDSTATAELAAVVGQIEADMTAAQLSGITAMQLTQTDLAAYMQEQGLQGSGQTSASQAEGVSTGGMMAGGGPGGEIGGMPPDELGGSAPATSGTAQQSEATSPARTALYDAVVGLLSARA